MMFVSHSRSDGRSSLERRDLVSNSREILKL
jgi:hypothetical protein